MTSGLTLDEVCGWLRDAVELRRDRTIGVALREVAEWFGLSERRAHRMVYRQTDDLVLRDAERATFRDLYVMYLRHEAVRRVTEAHALEARAKALDAKTVRLRTRRAAFGRPDAA